MRSARYFVAFLGAFAVLLAACSGGQQPAGGGSASPSTGTTATHGGSITFGLENAVSHHHPMLSGLSVDRNIMYAMSDSLVRRPPKGAIIPWPADTRQTSSSRH